MKSFNLSLMALALVFVTSCDTKTHSSNDAVVTETADASTLNKNETVNLNGTATTPEETAAPVNAEDAPVFSMASEVYDFGDVQANSTTERTCLLYTSPSPRD